MTTNALRDKIPDWSAMELRTLMLNNARLTLTVAVCLSAMLTLVGCGGVGAAPLNGVGALPGVTVSVSPAAMNITTGTTQPFTATVNNTSQAGVGWLVNGFPGGVNPSDGSTPFGVIDKDGNYTAPPFVPQPPTVTITAVATADNTASANAAASITGTPSPVSISPLTASLEVGRTVNGILVPGDVALFTASLRGSDSPLNWLVENKLNGDLNVGTITAVPGPLNQVVYTAPAVFPSAGTQVHITAQSILNPMEAATAVVNLLPVGSTLVSITSPKEPPTVQVTKTQAFVASVTGGWHHRRQFLCGDDNGVRALYGSSRAASPSSLAASNRHSRFQCSARCPGIDRGESGSIGADHGRSNCRSDGLREP